jgi:hypothetical protein
MALKEKCIMFSPASRPTASEVSDEFRLLLAKGNNVVISKNVMSPTVEKGLVSIFYPNYLIANLQSIIMQLSIHLTVYMHLISKQGAVKKRKTRRRSCYRSYK